MVKKVLTLFIFVLLHFPLVVLGASVSGNFSTNLISHWELEETSSTRYDSTTSNNDLTSNGTGGVGYNTGKIGNAGDFERGDSDYLSITDASQTGLDITGDHSISFWIKWEDALTSGQQANVLMKDSNGANSTRAYSYFFQNVGGTLTLRCELYPSGYSYPGYYAGTINVTPDVGSWVHFVITVDISETTNKVYVYKNGSGVGYMTLFDGSGATSIQNSTGIFQIGGNSWQGYSDGLIDEVSIWSGRILNSSDVSTIYNSGNGISYTETTILSATSTIPVQVNGGTIRINGGTFKNTQK